MFLHVVNMGDTPTPVQLLIDIAVWCWGCFFWLFFRTTFTTKPSNSNWHKYLLPTVGSIFALCIWLFQWSQKTEVFIVYIAVFATALTYQFFVIKGLQKYLKDAPLQLSLINTSLIQRLLLVATVQWIAIAYDASLMISIVLSIKVLHWQFVVIYLVEALLVIAICYLFVNERISPMKYSNQENEDEADNLVDAPTAQQIIGLLNEQMSGNKLFRNPDISLESLCEAVAVRRNIISQVLNKHLGTSFYQYINGFRLKEISDSLRDPGKARNSILDLAMDAGFGNKSTFNREFKKAYAMTPSQYRSKRAEVN